MSDGDDWWDWAPGPIPLLIVGGILALVAEGIFFWATQENWTQKSQFGNQVRALVFYPFACVVVLVASPAWVSIWIMLIKFKDRKR